jgi:hypothetical protein
LCIDGIVGTAMSVDKISVFKRGKDERNAKPNKMAPDSFFVQEMRSTLTGETSEFTSFLATVLRPDM